jgi:hypothetical protein
MQDDSRYYAEADACPHNTTSTVRNALARMAQTRSTNIALSRILNVPLTSAEELPNVDIDFETGEVTEKKDKNKILKEIKSLREDLSMEKADLAQLARDQYRKEGPLKLTIDELCDLRDLLEKKVKERIDNNEEEKAEAEKIEEDFLKQEEMEGNDGGGL